jgi:hypothetical protein
VVDAVLLPLAFVTLLAEDGHGAAEDGEHDAEDAAGVGDREGVGGDCDGHSAPGGHGRGREGAGQGFGVENTGVGFGEEDEESGCEETGHDRSQTLGEPLLLRTSAEQEAHAEVAYQVGGLVGTHVGDGTTEQVKALGIHGSPALSLGCATEHDLRGLRSSGQRGDVCNTGALDGEEGEDESQEDREQAHPDRHVVLNAHDHTDEDDDEDEHGGPPPHRDHLFGLGGIFDQVFLLLLGGLLQVRVVGTVVLAVDGVSLLAARAVDCLADEPEDLDLC